MKEKLAKINYAIALNLRLSLLAAFLFGSCRRLGLCSFYFSKRFTRLDFTG
jgi:hypothetical protein